MSRATDANGWFGKTIIAHRAREKAVSKPWPAAPSPRDPISREPQFKLGLSGCGGGLESISTSKLLDLAEQAEALGYDALWINEEHFQGSIVEVEGRRCHSPIVLASAILARTKKLRVGFSVLLLALHHPVRLAEEIATLDVLSDGRVDFGISRGGNGRYLEAYGVDPAAVPEKFAATLDFVLRAWQDEKVSFGANAWSIEPKPAQKPHPPVFMGTYTDDTAAWAARAGHNLIFHGITNMANQRRLMKAFVAAGGDSAAAPFGRFVYVGESDEAARQELWPTIEKLTTRLKGFRLFDRKGVLEERDLDPEVFYEEMVIAGGPETVAARILDLNRELGVAYLNALSAFFGFLPLPLLEPSLERLARDVRPLVENGLSDQARV